VVFILSRELVFGTFHFVRGEKRPAHSPSCSESNFFNLVHDFHLKGLLATSEDFDDLHCNGTKISLEVMVKKFSLHLMMDTLSIMIIVQMF